VRGRQLYVTMGGLVVLAAILIGISGIPRFKNGHGLDGIIGGIGWFGGLLCVLAVLVLGGMAIVRAVRGRREPASA
jgi:TM2 domain-containing membrane protein YozV